MCGIYGLASLNPINREEVLNSINKIDYRGPDHTGVWQNREGTVYFAHKRLAIIDLDSRSNQPMHFENLGLVITYNGELYNHTTLRNKLEKVGYEFITNSDTEVIVKSYDHFGVACLDHFIGMFSFCIFNELKNEIFIARDPAGEKPFYYSFSSSTFEFASEVKSMNSGKEALDLISLNYFLGALSMPNGKSIFKDIKQLKPGNYALFNLNKIGVIDFVEEVKYFEPCKKQNVIIEGLSSTLKVFDNLLLESLEGQLTSDVPLALLLSGGIDSSILTAKASEIIRNLKTFTVTFSSKIKFDESKIALSISKRFGTEHTELDLSFVDVNDFLQIVDAMDQPFADSSYIPTVLINREIAKQGIKVVLGGDGGDELFGGYTKYTKLIDYRNKSQNMPKISKRLMNKISSFYPFGFPNYNFISQAERLLEGRPATLTNSFDYGSRKHLLLRNIPVHDFLDSEFNNVRESYIEQLCLNDFNNYLNEDILYKVDRASMNSSVESRAPFLDRRIIEFAFNNVESKYKNDGKRSKILLQEYLKKIYPEYSGFNKKKGFVFPISKLIQENAEWRNVFREVIFNENVFFNKGYLNYLWKLNLIGLDQSQRLYAIFIFNRWVRNNYSTT